MAAEIQVSWGAELKDSFRSVNAYLQNGITFLNDIELFYRERQVIEKEYAAKLNALAKKYFEKKAKKQSALSVGDTPTVTPGSLESASMTTWGVQLTTLENRAAEHDRFGNQLISSLAEPLKNLAQRYEDLRKQHAEYAAKLEKERDGSYADLKKTKGKYDSVCQEVENKRKKTESSFDYGKAKAQSAYQGQMVEMRNQKNTYLIAIQVTNKQRERYYYEYVPELLDSLQGLSETRTSTLNTLWSTAVSIETKTMQNSAHLLEHLSNEIPRNNPVLDSMMFARHNAIQWQSPPDFAFEPSPVWLDDDAMAADPQSKVFLMNILTKSKGSLGELKRVCDVNRREVEGAKRVRQAIRSGKDKRDEVEVVRAQLHNQEMLHEAERKRTTAEVEVSTILVSVGDVSVGAKNHIFRAQTFKIPTNCDFCGDRIWGLSAKGMSCEECGFTCHTKCELKVAADCPGELTKEQKKVRKGERQASAAVAQAAGNEGGRSSGEGVNGGGGSGLGRSDTIGSMNTLSSGYAASAQRSVSGTTPRSSVAEDGSGTNGTVAPAAAAATPAKTGGRRLVAPPPSHYIAPTSDGDTEDHHHQQQKGKMLYTYTATGEGEISIPESQAFTLLEPDDGSGWIRIKASSFGSQPGLVPASYAEISTTAGGRSPRPISTATTSTTSLTGSDSPGGVGPPVAPKPSKKQGPAVAPRRGSKKPAAAVVKFVEALYTYSANGPGEVDMREGEKMVLVAVDQGDGWCEVESEAGRGVVPAGWVREV